MIIVQVKDGESIEKALKKAFEKPSVTNRKKMMKAVYVQQLRANEE